MREPKWHPLTPWVREEKHIIYNYLFIIYHSFILFLDVGTVC